MQLHEIDALWDLATGEAATHAAFLKQLTENRSLVLRFAQHPDPVIRAFGLRLTTEQTQALLDTVLDAIDDTTDPNTLSQLLAVVQVLQVQLTPEQVLRPLGRVFDTFVEGRSSQELLLLEHVKVLASRVTAEKAQTAANAILDGMRHTTTRPDANALWHQVRALQALPVQLTAEQAQAALGRVLDVIRDTRDTFSSYHDLLPLAQAVQALPVQLTAKQAQSAFRRVLDTINNTATPLNMLKDLAQAVQALASKLSTEQAQAALRDQAQAALAGRFLNAMQGTNDPEALKEAAQLIQELPVQLTAEQMQAGLGHVLGVIRDSNDPNALQPLLKAVQLIPVPLTAEQAQSTLGHVLDVIRATTAGEDWRHWMAAHALASKLSTEQAQAAFGAVLDAMRGTTDSEALKARAQLVQALARKLSVDQAQAALGHMLNLMYVLNPMQGTSNAEALPELAQAIQALASKLTTDRHQAQAVFGPILDAVRATTESEALWTLLEVVQELAPQLTTEQAQAALVLVLDMMRDPLELSIVALQGLAATINALSVQLTVEQMQLALDSALYLLLLIGPIGLGDEGRYVGKAIEALAPRLAADQAQAALRAILHAMFSRGWLGVELRFVSEETAGNLGLLEPRGALVGAVMSGSPADNAKILTGDVILAFDGKAIATAPTLGYLIAGERPGKEAVVTLWRRGEKKNLTVLLGEDTLQIDENSDAGEKYSAALSGMAKAVKALPVQLTTEQAQLAHSGILKALRQNTSNSSTHYAMAKVVETLAPKLTDEAKANMLGVVRSGLAAVGSSYAAIEWARAFETLLPPSPVNAYVGAIVEVLKYPTTALGEATILRKAKTSASDSEPTSATEYLLGKLHERFPDTQELQSDNLQDTLAWIAKSYPEIGLTSPPVWPAGIRLTRDSWNTTIVTQNVRNVRYWRH